MKNKFPTISIILSGSGGMEDSFEDEDLKGFAAGTKYEGYTGYARGTVNAPRQKVKKATGKGKGAKKSLSQMLKKSQDKIEDGE